MTLFSSLTRARSSAANSDEKDHDSDGDNGGGGGGSTTNIELGNTTSSSSSSSSSANNTNSSNNTTIPSSSSSSSSQSQRTPLLQQVGKDEDSSSSSSSSFPLRIKLNDGKTTIDYTLDGILLSSPTMEHLTVKKLKECILTKHFTTTTFKNSTNGGDVVEGIATANSNNSNNRNRYLRLIVRGRMMAPDTSPLTKFSIVPNDVIHAVLAKEGVRGGQQARMLRRLNHHNGTNNNVGGIGGRGGGGSTNTSASGIAGAGGSTGHAVTSSLTSAGESSSRNRIEQNLWRRIGIDADGVVVPTTNNNDEDSDSEVDSDFEDAHGEIDLEVGRGLGQVQRNNSISGSNNRGEYIDHHDGSGRRQGRRRRRERRGFDRLRAVGMTRDEVTAIRLYFARNVDRYIERRRVMIRASRRLRESLEDIMDVNNAGGGDSNSSRQRSSTGDEDSSTNSLVLDDGSSSGNNENPSSSASSSSTNNTNHDVEGGVVGSNSSNSNVEETEVVEDSDERFARRVRAISRAEGEYNRAIEGNEIDGSVTAITSANDNNNSSPIDSLLPASATVEGEEILIDRLRMEDEWMSTQGPYSEFRMNLNTSNPLLLAAITGGGGGGNATLAGSNTPLDMTMGPAGLFFRARNNNNGGAGAEDDIDDMFGSDPFNPMRNAAGRTNNPNAFHPHNMGPVPSAGTDKDFVWGFILGFFVGFIMLFWVWMPTVPHKQKIGIISGISFQLGLNLLRKSSQGGQISGGGSDGGDGSVPAF